MNRICWSVLVPGLLWSFAVPLNAQHQSTPMSSPPALPWIDDGACPFEGCAYREWTAIKSATLYDTWQPGKRKIGEIATGTRVTALTGTVVTHRPGMIRIDRDLIREDLSAGDQILTYTYKGEGHSAVWFKGKFYPEFDISFTKWPDGTGCGGSHCAATYIDLGEKVWWAQVRLQSGQVGWVNMNESDFEGIDILGALPHMSVRTTAPALHYHWMPMSM
jgi:hypothetical protein